MGRSKVEYLGYQLSPNEIFPLTNKQDGIMKFTLPHDATGIRCLLGMVGFYRRFIKEFSIIAEPLTRLTKKLLPGQKFGMTDDGIAAFENIKKALASTEVMIIPDHSKRFIIKTDASIVGYGAVLSQMDEKTGCLRPVMFASRRTSVSERNYSAPESEAHAVVWACDHFKSYLFGKRFTLKTDHMALKRLF